MREIRHLIELFKLSIMVYTDHDTALPIAKQTSLFTFLTDKLSLRLVRAFDYIQPFSFEIRHNSDIFHIISDALFRLFSINTFRDFFSNNNKKLDVLFTAFMIEMNINFKIKMIESYRKNSVYVKIFDMLAKNNIKLHFLIENELLYRKKKLMKTCYLFRKECVYCNS